ncbi:MAG: hypothetical protein K0S61_3801 [Anaerocolumna sp.]|nr:hypothetical protein [Anaerocolumna sp.]
MISSEQLSKYQELLKDRKKLQNKITKSVKIVNFVSVIIGLLEFFLIITNQMWIHLSCTFMQDLLLSEFSLLYI